MTFRPILFVAFLFTFCSCKNDSLTENQASKFDSVFLEYLPIKYDVGYILIFQNKKKEEIKLRVGTGTTSNPETNEILSISRNINGMLKEKNISIMLTINKNNLKGDVDHMTFGILEHGRTLTPNWTLNQKNDSSDKAISDHFSNKAQLALLNENSIPITEDGNICLTGNFENDNNSNTKYEMCIAKNIGISSFTLYDEQWSFVKIDADRY